jgi:hypothetical protein
MVLKKLDPCRIESSYGIRNEVGEKKLMLWLLKQKSFFIPNSDDI